MRRMPSPVFGPLKPPKLHRLSKQRFEDCEFELASGRFYIKPNSEYLVIVCKKSKFVAPYIHHLCDGCKLNNSRDCGRIREVFALQCERTHKHPELFL